MSFAERFPEPMGDPPPLGSMQVDPNDTAAFFAVQRLARAAEAWHRAYALHHLAVAVDRIMSIRPHDRSEAQTIALLLGLEKLESRFMGDNWLARALSGASL